VKLLSETREQAFAQWNQFLDFVFIDGCHGKPCVMGDFQACEPWVNKGGLVVFHDFGERSVGQLQPHCNGPSNVVGALKELGLLDGSKEEWVQGCWFGDRAKMGADCAVFERQ
jgi:hypothetical protein